MHILFISPCVSQNYKAHIESIAGKAWHGEKFFKRDIKQNERTVGKSFYCLGLLTLASMLPPEISFTFVDENFEKNRVYEEFRQKKYDVVAITAQLIQAQRAKELIRFFVESKIHVVAGGAHPTTFPDDYIQPGVSVVIGEGEDLFAEFLNDFSVSSPKPFYKKRDQVADQNSRIYVDMNRLPVPDFSLISRHRYSMTGVQTTRGCPYRCKFCTVSGISGHAYRHKPVEQVKEEVLQVKRLWPQSRFLFFDDNTFADRKYACRLFEALQDIKLGNWIAHADISVSEDSELLELVASNGNPFFYIGFETLSQKNAKIIGNEMKADFLARYRESILKLKGKNIMVGGSFIFGFKGDSKAGLEQTMSFIRGNNIDGYITRYAALPGSWLYKELLEEYRRTHGPVSEKGTPQAKLINKYFMQKNGFGFNEPEDIILDVLKANTTSELPMVAIDNLATYKCFMG
jgi:radical SAM superfamily enzyme YgiQ (UPF0313 family)